jgi:hypothetical protein
MIHPPLLFITIYHATGDSKVAVQYCFEIYTICKWHKIDTSEQKYILVQILSVKVMSRD